MITTYNQLRKLRNLYLSIKLRKRTRFPKMFVERKGNSYILWGFESKNTKGEELVNVCDSSEMEERMFLNMVFGPVNEFLGGNVDDIHRYFPFA